MVKRYKCARHQIALMDHVLAKVAAELQRRKDHRLVGSTWLWLCQELGLGKQNATGWLNRGAIPPKHHPAIAQLFGWSLDQMMDISRTPETREPEQENVPPVTLDVRQHSVTTKPKGVPVTHVGRVGADGSLELFDTAPGRSVGGIDGSPRAYAVVAQGDALMPYIRHGQAVVIDPAIACDSGDMVLVTLRAGAVFVRELLSLGDVVRAAHPVSGVRESHDAMDVARVHYIAGVMSPRAVVRPDAGGL